MKHPTLTDLVHCHVGRPGVVLGGGPSMPAQIERCPQDAVWISANDHGAKFREVDYLCAIDRGMEKPVRRFGKPVLSIREWADYRILENPAPSSGILGAFSLWAMGCAPIVLLGMDCYQAGTYAEDPEAFSTGRQHPLHEHLGRWRRFLATYPGMFRTMGETALAEVVPEYHPGEAVPPPLPADEIRRRIAGPRIRFLQTCTLRRKRFQPGDEAEVRLKDAMKAVTDRQARYL